MAFSKDKSPRVYVGTITLGPEQQVPAHEHKDAWEILVPIQASGVFEYPGDGLAADKGPFPKTLAARPGSIVMMPAGAKHAWKPDGTSPLIAIQLFVPPGPEERYATLAGAPAAASSR